MEYEGRLQGNHDGIIFNRREKDVFFYFTIEDSKPERSPESVIFASSQEYYCDGVYATVFDGDDHPSALNIDLGERFNREFFEISFEYYILPEDGPRASSGVLFSLGREYEILHVSWDWDGYLNIVLNNGDNIYGTAIKSVPGRWMRLDLCYDRGRLFVNGLSFDVETISDKGIEGDN
ncbi:MAG: hypothetical protein II719_00715, partial [Clostridia bacterium]|nr:hypothetical protein [Clostridia bacterium]